ncbi:hypothetical protein DWX43_16970 [Clostridium sp. AF19-22AC]|uniref:hypothetical protein n=1 Tax=Clostridia TaxID=186801 RepID=UPI000E51F4A4|nr:MULTISPECIES: hypothetical protein [Clostridia]RHR25817.1 hypothetical protein DWX43_16970 [Clostridium sp. AF19-22AC]
MHREITGKQKRKIYGGILFGIIAAVMISGIWMKKSVYAADLDRQINERTDENNPTDVQGDLDIAGELQNETAQSSAASSHTQNSSNATASSKIPTNGVGNGIIDQVSKNAKTGDVFNGRNIVVLLAALGVLAVLLNFRREKKEE